MRLILNLLAIVALTVATQLGGIAWLISFCFRRRWQAFFLAYAALILFAHIAAPLAGRVPINCFGGGSLQVQSWFFCATNRNYVTRDLRDVAKSVAESVNEAYPGTVTQALDGNFPFFDGFPLLPHLSHADGRKLDLAFYYNGRDGSYQPGLTRSPIG